MKKMACLAIAVSGVAVSAHAQNSVTLYGLIDEGLTSPPTP